LAVKKTSRHNSQFFTTKAAMGAAMFSKILLLNDTALHSTPCPLCPLRRLGVLGGKKNVQAQRPIFTTKAAMGAAMFTKILLLNDTALHSTPCPLCPLRRLGVLCGKKNVKT
jgi:disulfide bond formation protein DsbB